MKNLVNLIRAVPVKASTSLINCCCGGWQSTKDYCRDVVNLMLLPCVLIALGLPLPSVVILSFSFLGLIWLSQPFTRRDPTALPLEAPFLALTAIAGSITMLVVIFGGVQRTLGMAVASLAICSLTFHRLRTKCPRENLRWESPLVHSAVLITLISLVSKLFVFLVPLALAVALSLAIQLLKKRTTRRISQSLSIAVPLVLALSSIWSRSMSRTAQAEGMVFRSMDQYFRTSIGFATARFGTHDHPGAIGFTLDYHWLSEAMMGLLSSFARLTTLDSVVWLSPIAGTFAAIAGTVCLASRIGMSTREGMFASTLLAVFSTLLYGLGLNILKPTEMGQFWGTPMFLLVLVCLLDHVKRMSISTMIHLAGSIALLAVTNITLMGVAILTICISLALGWTSRLLSAGQAIGSMFTCVVIASTVVFTLLSPSSRPEFPVQLQPFPPLRFGLVFGYSGTLWYVSIISVITGLLVMAFQGGGGVLVGPADSDERSDQFGRQVMRLGVVVGILLSALVTMPNSEQYRFALPMLILGPIMTAEWLPHIVGFWRSNRRIILYFMVLSGVALGTLVGRFLPKSFGDLQFMIPRFLFVGSISALLIAVWLCVQLGVGGLTRHRPRLTFAALLIPLSFGLLVSHTSLNSIAQYRYGRTQVGPSHADKERYECLNQLSRISHPSEVIASNFWNPSSDPTQQKSYLATAVSERRSFLDGPYYVQVKLNPDPWLQKRIDLSIRFAASPSQEDLLSLHAAGVRYFVVDRRQPHATNWSRFGSVAHANARCIVIDLDDPALVTN